MAKRKRATTKKQIEKRLNEGRGQGTFDQYTPWLKIQDVASLGLVTRIKGWKTNRLHQFLSKLELSYFYLLEWSKEVIDIREQFPLDLEETKAIAQELGIKHPTDPFTQEPIVMTTDFLITLKKPITEQEIARTIKYARDLSSKRVLEKFEIEKVYWQNRNIDWAIITEKDINLMAVENIKWLHSCRESEGLPIDLDDKSLKKAFSILEKALEHEAVLVKATTFCDLQMKYPSGTGLTIFRYFAANHQFNLDITQPLNPRKIVHLTNKLSKGGLR
jgi:hypothetical protein